MNVVCEDVSFVLPDGKAILDNVSLCAGKGELLAIMGPSGSGKTSLLNIIAGRTRNKVVAPGTSIGGKSKYPQPLGRIYLNGNEVTSSTMRNSTRYVMQQDCLLPFLTVEETVRFTAKLKLHHLSKQEREQRVEAVLTELGLQGCRKVRIGNELVKGVSGGQKKRVAIAMELLDNPDLLFLDEPTSGLDSSLAFDVMKTLRRLTQRGRTVVATIHQPRSQIYAMFDSLLLLSQGRIVFHGPATETATFFEQAGHPVLPHFNAADHFLDLLTVESAQVLTQSSSRLSLLRSPGSLRKGGSKAGSLRTVLSVRNSFVGLGGVMVPPHLDEMSVLDDEDNVVERLEGVGGDKRARLTKEEIDKFPEIFIKSRWSTTFAERKKKLNVEKGDVKDLGELKKVNPIKRIFANTATLTHRRWTCQTRDVISKVIGVLVVSIMSIVVGCLWFRVDEPANNSDCKRYFNFLGAVAFAAINNSFSMMQAGIGFPEERPLFNREVASKLYHSISFYLGMNIADFIFQLLNPFAHTLVVYWMVRFGTTTGQFFFYLLTVCVVALASASWVQLMAMLSPSSAVAAAIAPTGIMLAVLLCGLWITLDSLPAFWHGISFLSWIRYAMNGYLLMRFDPSLIATCAEIPTIPNWWQNILCVVAFIVVVRFLGFFALKFTNRRVGMEA